MKVRRVMLVAALTPVAAALVGVATNAVSGARHWPGGLDFVRTHGLPSLIASLFIAAVLGALPVVRPPAKLPTDTSAVADLLAGAVHTELDDEARWQRLFDPYPLPVSWDSADEELMVPWSAVLKLAAATPGSPTAAMDVSSAPSRPSLAGSGSDLVEVFFRVPTRRLVVLGGPGAGKTILLVTFALELLKRREGGEPVPVPVLLPLASWDPVDEDLDAWAVRWLTTGRSALSRLVHDGSRSTLAKALLDKGLILLILDGLDEIPPAVRGKAIASINRAMRPEQGLVLASRTGEYRSAVRPAQGTAVQLTGARGIELCPLDHREVAEYLTTSAGGQDGAARWDAVIATFTENPSPPAAQVLTTPLMATLARTIYNPHPHEKLSTIPQQPAELTDPELFSTPERIERHLFDCYIPACYRKHQNPEHPSQYYRWTADQAQRWLMFLARQLDRQGTSDLEWWKLPRAAPRHFVAIVLSVVIALISGIGYEYAGLGVGLTVALAAGFTVRLLSRADADHTSLTQGGVGGLLGGVFGGSVAVIVLGPGMRDHVLGSVLAAGLAMGFAVICMGTFIAGLSGGFVGTIAVAFYEHASLFRGIRSTVGTGSHVINGFGLGLTALFIIELAARSEPAKGPRWSPTWSACGIACGFVLGFVVWAQVGPGPGLAAGVATVIAGALTGVVGQAAATDLKEAPDPDSVMRRDRSTFLASCLSAGLAVAISTGLGSAVTPGITGHPNGLRYGLQLGITNLVIIGVCFGFMQAMWGRYIMARCWLAACGQIPWRFMAFLRDAHENHGVLRRVGAVYQFRHVELRWHLAERFDTVRDLNARRLFLLKVLGRQLLDRVLQTKGIITSHRTPKG